MARTMQKRSFASLSGNWTFAVGLCAGLLWFLFDLFGDPGRGLAAGIGAGMTVLVTRYFWDLRRRVWFWITMAIIVLAHVLLVVFIRWPSARVTWVALLPVGWADFGVCYGIIRLAEVLFSGDGNA
jgi:hypothetical protein